MVSIVNPRRVEPSIRDGATVRIVGLGGVGCVVARNSCMFFASLNTPVRALLLDGDSFEPGNATRMFFSSHGNKASVLREELLPRFRESQLSLLAVEEYVTPENIHRLLGPGSPEDIIMLCVDNHATRKLVSDYCSSLSDICLISGGNDGVGTDASGRVRAGTFGNCQIHVRRGGADLTPPLTRFHPEIEHPEDALPSEKSCTDLVASLPQILFANLTVAAAMLNTLWLHLGGQLHYGEICFDIAVGQMAPIPLPRAAGCDHSRKVSPTGGPPARAADTMPPS